MPMFVSTDNHPAGHAPGQYTEGRFRVPADIPNIDPKDNKGQRAKQRRKNRVLDEIRFQSRKRNR